MKQQSKTGTARLVAAFRNSMVGLRDVWMREEAFRMEAVLFLVSIPVAIWIGSGIGQIGLLIGSILALLIVEILNSALEAVVDRIGLERHELSRIAKDLGSTAVLLTALFPISVWSVVLLNYLGLISL